MEESTDVLDKQWFRYLVVAALLSGAGGGLSSLTAPIQGHTSPSRLRPTR
jgi:hypothetical protein